MIASDVMTRPAVTVRDDAGVREAAKIMSDKRISALPVLDTDGTLVGVVSEGDLFRRAELGTRSHRSWWLELVSNPADTDLRNLRETSPLVSAVMTTDVATEVETAPLDQIADTLATRHIKRLPIIDDKGAVVGIVSRADLVRALAHQGGGELRTSKSDRALRSEVMAALGALGSASLPEINVIVERGEVSVWGLIYGEENRRPILETVKGIPGVNSVHDHLGLVPLWYLGE